MLFVLLLAIFGAQAFQGGCRQCFSSKPTLLNRLASTTRTITTKKLWDDDHYHCRCRFATRSSNSFSQLFSSATEGDDDADNNNNNKSDEESTQPAAATTATTIHDSSNNNSGCIDQLISTFTLWTPLWTILASMFAVWKASLCSKTVGSIKVLQAAYWTLMLTMGLAISQKDLEGLKKTSPSVIVWNALLCFGGMPLLALGISNLLRYSFATKTGLVVLGSVGGGQASNLFALLAGGNVALSVLCTISTTLLGVVATPILLETLLGNSGIVASSALGVLQSIVSLVLFPIAVGSWITKTFPKTLQRISKYLPVVGVTATLLLVAGGSSNSFLATEAFSFSTQVFPSCFLGIAGALVALGVANGMEERTKRTLVVETLSKSPTLAYLLCLRHFGPQAALVPGGAMVTLAVLGALVASVWSRVGVGE